MNVQLFVPCFIDQLYPQVAFNTIKVLEKAGCTVHYNPSQTCCAGLRECKIKTEPRSLLQNVKGLELVEMEHTDTCCGFGGSFAVKFDTISVAMADQKIDNAIATTAEYIVSTDMSCLMHLDGRINFNGQAIQVKHISDILASGY